MVEGCFSLAIRVRDLDKGLAIVILTYRRVRGTSGYRFQFLDYSCAAGARAFVLTCQQQVAVSYSGTTQSTLADQKPLSRFMLPHAALKMDARAEPSFYSYTRRSKHSMLHPEHSTRNRLAQFWLFYPCAKTRHRPPACQGLCSIRKAFRKDRKTPLYRDPCDGSSP